MPKEIILYNGLHNWSAERLITELNDRMKEEVVIRVNSPGGDVFASWGLFDKVSEHGNVTVKLDGMAASGAFNFLLYAKKVIALDVSSGMAHRAAHWMEPNLTDEGKAIVLDQNTKLRSKMEKKINSESWKRITGVSMDEMFDMSKRVNVWLSAQQMKDLGVVNEIKQLTPTEATLIAAATEEWAMQIAASSNPQPFNDPTKNQNMTLEKLKAEFPAVYAQILAEGEKAGIKKEQDRVGAWMAWAEVDPKKVKEGIDKGEEINAKATQEFTVAMLKGDYLKKLAAESSDNISTDAGGAEGDKDKNKNPKTAAEKSLAEFEAELDKGKKKTAAAA